MKQLTKLIVIVISSLIVALSLPMFVQTKDWIFLVLGGSSLVISFIFFISLKNN